METKQISFKVLRDELELIDRIANRALNMAIQYRVQHKKQDFAMDLTCVHANGNPLRLRELLEADEFNFAHDVFGIREHLDRETGELLDFFSPRFSARVRS
jgi:hypothetical protein